MSSLLDQAITLHNQGRLTEAEQMYRSVLAAEPRQPDALALLGVLLAARKEYKEAVSFLDRAIACDPATPLFRLYLGNIFLEKGEDARAAEAFRDALLRQPDFVDAHIKLSLILEKQNNLSESAKHLYEAAIIMPDYGAVWTKLSELCLRNEDYALAYKAAETAVRLTPDNLAAHIAQALALDALDKEEEAVASLTRAIQIKQDFVEAWDMLASAYQKLGRLDEAENTYRKSMDIAGCVIEDEDKRIVDEKEYSVQHWNLALLELLRGDFRRGFAHYRARFKKTGRAQRLAFPRPIWNGEDLRGKKIFVVGEQGFGDVLMLCRFLPALKAKGAHVVLLAHEALAKLLKEAKIADEILTEAPTAQGDFDYQTSIFDLPLWLKTEIGTIPAATYLPSPAPHDAAKPPDERHKKIGVVWAGKKDFGNDRRRSIPLAIFSKLFAQTNATFYNFTRDQKPGDAEIMKQHSVVDLSGKLGDFYTTAQFVAQMDLIITCDTAMAHLAGGMGKKVWTLLPFAPDWRWLTDREDSPWYPSMRLFRQNIIANWDGVITRVNDELDAFICNK